MFGRVRLKYRRLLTSAQCLVGEGRRLPESLSNGALADRRMDAGFISSIPDLCRRSVIYILCERNKHVVEGITSTPKKWLRQPRSFARPEKIK